MGGLGGFVPPNPKSRQELSKENGIKSVGYTFRFKKKSKSPPFPSDFSELAPPLRELSKFQSIFSGLNMWDLNFSDLDIWDRSFSDLSIWDLNFSDLNIWDLNFSDLNIWDPIFSV